MTLRTWNGRSGSYGNGSNWTPQGTPRPGDTLVVQSGTVTLGNVTLAGVRIDLTGSAAAPPVLAISNVSIGAGSSVQAGNFVFDINNYNFSGIIQASGNNSSAGTIGATSSDFQRAATLTLNITAGGFSAGRFTNTGTIASNPMGRVNVHAASPGATLVNSGLIDIAGHGTIDAAVAGTGTMRLEAAIPLHGFVAAPELTLGAIGSGQTIQFVGGDDLKLADLANFHGLISGFDAATTAGAHDRIELLGHAITASSYANGVLTLQEGAATAGQLRFAAVYSGGSFVLTQGQAVTASGAVVATTTITLAG